MADTNPEVGDPTPTTNEANDEVNEVPEDAVMEDVEEEGDVVESEDTQAADSTEVEAQPEDFQLLPDNLIEIEDVVGDPENEGAEGQMEEEDGENEVEEDGEKLDGTGELEGDGDLDDTKEEEEEEDEDDHGQISQDPNVMPQINVGVLAQRKWQVKVYPLKPDDFVNGQISTVFKHARESLLYLLSPGRNARGKGEMYVSTVNQAVRCVSSLMRLEYFYPEINLEIIKKNDEGAIEEKAYLRFDSKLTHVLNMRSHRRPFAGRKKDRLIGSVFLKNLPPGTTKDILRVMFPFAQEVNYNPEKFKDCTARLVLNNRNHVIPCLKAFAKVELGGNVLELHPLAKRKRTRTEEDTGVSDAKQRKREESSSKDEKSESVKKPEEKKEAHKRDSKERSSSKPSDAKPSENKAAPNKSDQNRSVLTRPRSTSTKGGAAANDQRRPLDNKRVRTRSRRNPFVRPRGGAITPRSTENRQNRSPASSSTRSFSNNRDNRRRDSSSSGRGRGSYRGGSGAGRGGLGRREDMRMAGYNAAGAGGLGVPASLAASDVSLAASAEATKEMVLLQNQLSVAIKNQLAMLNQTTMAVEQAKRGAASSVGLGSERQLPSSLVPRSSSKAYGEASTSRRSVDQYRTPSSLNESGDSYNDRFQERERPKPRRFRNRRGGGGDGNSGAGSNSSRGGRFGAANSSGGGGRTGSGARAAGGGSNSGGRGGSRASGGSGGRGSNRTSAGLDNRTAVSGYFSTRAAAYSREAEADYDDYNDYNQDLTYESGYQDVYPSAAAIAQDYYGRSATSAYGSASRSYSDNSYNFF